MLEIRKNFSVGYIDGYIYIIGGCKTQSAERLNLKALQNQKNTENAGQLKYQQQSLAVCGGWGKVFAVGCYKIEMCMVNEHIWSEFLINDEPLWGKFPGCVCVNDQQLLVFGGEGFNNCVIVSQGNASLFDQDHLPIQGAFLNNCCVVENNIYAMKYVMKGSQEINYVLVYDKDEGGWTQIQ